MDGLLKNTIKQSEGCRIAYFKIKLTVDNDVFVDVDGT